MMVGGYLVIPQGITNIYTLQFLWSTHAPGYKYKKLFVHTKSLLLLSGDLQSPTRSSCFCQGIFWITEATFYHIQHESQVQVFGYYRYATICMYCVGKELTDCC